MGRFFRPNIDSRGRLARGVWGGILLVGGIITADHILWLCLIFVGFGLFAIFEALRGWCILRACKIKTPM
jgi:hypothetical protein